MKKKGFTLIELLAVIVILAIIALIATPLVLKYIEKSRKESKVDSAYSFVRNLETEIANYSIKNKGTKYNGQPNDKGYYDLNSFKDSEIDTTVKGDNPSEIKVCLSSLGQVEKAIFNFNDGKYYVSYDGKKSSISDKDKFDNFSCSDNKPIIDQEVTFTYDNDEGTFVANLTDEQFDNLYAKVKNITYYNFKLDDKEFNNLTSTFLDVNGELSLFITQDGKTCLGIMQSQKKFLVLDETIEDGKKYKLTFEESVDKPIRHVMRINSSPYTNIYGYDFVEGDAHILIKDSEGVEYLNIDTQFESMGYAGLYGALIYSGSAYNNELKNVYNAMAAGKVMTVVVTQNGVSTTIGGEKANYDGSQYYYLGNNAVWHWD